MRVGDYHRLPLFRSLGRIDLAKLAAHLVHVEYAKGEEVFRQGESGEDLFIILEGRVGLRRPGSDAAEATIFGPGECVGVLAALSRGKRAATAVALEKSVLLRLGRKHLDLLASKYPAIGMQFAAMVARRYGAAAPGIETGESGPSPVISVKTNTIFSTFLSIARGWALLTAVAFLLACLAAWFLLGAGFDRNQALICGILLGATILWTLDLFSYHAVALAIPILLILFQVGSLGTALSGFISSSWFLVLGVFSITAAISRTGLMYRLVLLLARHFPANYPGQILALAVSGLLLTPVIPSSNGRAALAGPLVQSLCEMLRFRKQSRATAGVAMAALLGFGHMSSLFMNGTATCLLALALLPPDVAGTMTWGRWFIDALPLGMTYFLLCYLSILYLYLPKRKAILPKGNILSQLQIIGPMQTGEVLSLLIILLCLGGFITQPWHGIHPAWVAMAAFLLLMFTRILDEKAVRSEIDWNFLLSFGALVGLGAVIAEHRLQEVLGEKLIALLGIMGESPFLFLATLSIGVTLARFALPLPAGLLIGILPTIPVAAVIGIHPFVVAQTVLLASNPWFFPHQNSVYQNLVENMEGNTLSHPSARKLSFFQVAAILLALAVALPFWRLRGLVL